MQFLQEPSSERGSGLQKIEGQGDAGEDLACAVFLENNKIRSSNSSDEESIVN